MPKWFKISAKIAIIICVLAGGVYAYAVHGIQKERDKVWEKIVVRSREYVKEHPEVTQEELNEIAKTVYLKVLEEQNLL